VTGEECDAWYPDIAQIDFTTIGGGGLPVFTPLTPLMDGCWLIQSPNVAYCGFQYFQVVSGGTSLYQAFRPFGSKEILAVDLCPTSSPFHYTDANGGTECLNWTEAVSLMSSDTDDGFIRVTQDFGCVGRAGPIVVGKAQTKC
jgi:hypothetical protein